MLGPIKNEKTIKDEEAPIQWPGPFGPLTMKDLKESIKLWLYERWNEEWHCYPQARQTKLWLPNVPGNLKVINNSDKKALAKIVQFITGHGPFLRHLMIDQPDNDITCRPRRG